MAPSQALSRILLVAASGLIAPTAWSADSLAQRIEACAQHQDDASRLQCFDHEVSALRAARSGPEAVGDRHAAEPSRPAPVVSPRDKVAVDQPVTARIVSVSKPARVFRIELDNGQVWEQNEHDEYLTLSPGDDAEIKPGALKSFLLRTSSGATTHVHRVR